MWWEYFFGAWGEINLGDNVTKPSQPAPPQVKPWTPGKKKWAENWRTWDQQPEPPAGLASPVPEKEPKLVEYLTETYSIAKYGEAGRVKEFFEQRFLPSLLLSLNAAAQKGEVSLSLYVTFSPDERNIQWISKEGNWTRSIPYTLFAQQMHAYCEANNISVNFQRRDGRDGNTDYVMYFSGWGTEPPISDFDQIT